MLTFNLADNVLAKSGAVLSQDFANKKAADNNVKDSASVTIAGSMVAVDKSDGGFTPMIGSGKSVVLSSGVSRFSPALDAPAVKEQGMAVQDGSTGYFVLADAAVNIYGFNEKNGSWIELGSPAAKVGFNVPMNSEYAHAQHGNINISRVFVRDPSATAGARTQARMIPQKGVSGAGAVAAAGKSQFTKDVEIDQDLQVDGAIYATDIKPHQVGDGINIVDFSGSGFRVAGDGSMAMGPAGTDLVSIDAAGTEVSLGPIGADGISANIQSSAGSVQLGPIGSDGIAKLSADQNQVQLGPIGSDGIALNIADSAASFGKAGSVNLKADANFVFAGKPGTATNGLYVHKEHGVCLVSAGGKAFGLRVDESGNITTTDLSVVDPDLEVPMC